MADGLPRASSHACASTQGEVEKGLRGEARLRLPAKHAVRSLIGVEIDRSAWKERLLRITHEAHWTGRRPPMVEKLVAPSPCRQIQAAH